MDEVTWAALAATLTLLGLAWTWFAFRRGDAAAGLRALGVTMLPVAAWLTGTLEMFTEIAGSVTDWATSLVFNPLTWGGIGLAGSGVALIVLSGILRDRQRAGGNDPAPRTRRPLPEASSTRGSGSKAIVDDDLADIEDILKRRGIK